MLRALLSALLTLRGLVTLLGLVAIAALIWFGGSYVSLWEQRPLQSESTRAAVILGLFAAVVAVMSLRYWLARRANQRMIKSLMENESLITVSDDRSQEEIDLIRERFEDALKVLRETVFQGRNGPGYLFELPWYIIIGPPGAGKTTILRNSGLEFPLAKRLGVDPVSGIGGTRNCDWWFTDQAVLIDTAGRYTTQDTNAEVDRAAWRGFLDLLRTHRRRRPINGVLLAISLSDLLLRNEAERKQHIEALRARIQELLKAFGMQIPIYVMVTKCDLICGFNEYFGELTEDERAQVWGMTFPPEGAGDRLTDAFDAQMQGLLERIEANLLTRMHAERNLARRATMYAFPKEFWSIRTLVGGFIADVFRSSRFDVRPMLRGIYFTSGTQEGTPIDRLIGALSRNFGLQSGQRPSQFGQGKAFFIQRLLTEVVFAEQGLVGTDGKLERKLALVHTSGYAAALALMVGASLLWYGAFSRGEARIGDTRLAAQTAQVKLSEIGARSDFGHLLPALNAARDVRVATGENSFFAWLDGVGLAVAPTLAPLAQKAYDSALVERLLPAFGQRLAARIDAILRTGDEALLDEAREVFRTYLMLGTPSRFDRANVARAARAEAQLAYPLDPNKRREVEGHFARLIELLPEPLEIDVRFAASVRSRLARRPRVDHVYARLLREGAQNPRLRPVDMVALIGTGALEISAARRPVAVAAPLNVDNLTLPNVGAAESTIPGIFTREGFYDFVLPRLPVLVREEQGADWVIAGASQDDSGLQQVTRQVMDRYVADYIRTWNGAISSIGVLKFDDVRRGLTVLQILAGPQTPLQRLVNVVRENTDLPIPGEGAAQAAAQGAPTVLASAASTVASRAANSAVSAALGDGPWPGKKIAEAFQPLAQLAAAGSDGQTAGILRIRDLLGGMFGTLSGIATAPDARQAAFQLVQRRIKDPNNDAFAAVRADATLRPEPIRAIMQEVAASSWAALMRRAHEYVNEAWTREVVPVCQGVIFQRYPMFGGSSEDVTLKDFGDFFRPGGVVDDFYVKYMAGLVVDQRRGLAPASVDGVTMPFRPDSLAQFQRARSIKSAFFSGAGSAPTVKFSIRPVFMDPSVLRATFVMDGKEVVYRHELPRAYDLEWPTRSEASSVAVTLVTVEGQEQKVERSGPWALFRLVDASQLASRGGADRFTFTVGKSDGPRISYELRAASVSNAFSLSVLRSFRCPDVL